MFNSFWPHGLYNPWNSPSPNTGVGSCSLLQRISLTKESNQGLLHCRWLLYKLCYQGSPAKLGVVSKSMEKAMAPHSSTLAWKTLWTEEPCRLRSMVSLRVRHDWATSLSLFTFLHWRREWQPTPVFLSGESQGWGPGGLLSMGLHRVRHNWWDSGSSNPDQLSFPEVMTSLKTSFNFTMKCKRLMDCCKMQTKGKAFSKFLSPVN